MAADPYNKPLDDGKRAKKIVVVVLVVFAVLVAVFGFFLLPLAQKDSGIEACKALADRGRTAATTSDTPMSNEDYIKLREIFHDSDVEAIRREGTAFVDITWQVANMNEGDPLILVYAGRIVDSYTKLSTACADNGVPLPSLAELTDIRESATPSSSTD